MRPDFTAFHRPVIRAGVQSPEAVPLADWSRSWAEARNLLLTSGLAYFVHGILVIAPIATIEMETTYG